MTDKLRSLLLELISIAKSNEAPISQYLKMKEKIKNLEVYLIEEINK